MHTLIDVFYLGKPIDAVSNCYHRKALLEMKQLYLLLLYPFKDELIACRGHVNIYICQNFKKEKVECKVTCPILAEKIEKILKEYFG
ncbi:MAG: hypothetical protein Q8K70_12055 [Bacteroidota bacterium]|nr:hypothetical protein [Bacteroidota bacterium]